MSDEQLTKDAGDEQKAQLVEEEDVEGHSAFEAEKMAADPAATAAKEAI